VAYREFWEAPVPEAVNPIANTSRAIVGLFSGIAANRKAKQRQIDEYKYTLNKGTFENDNIYFEEGAKAVTSLMKEGMKEKDNYKIQGAKTLAEQLETQNQERRRQDELFKRGDSIIEERAKKDKYYEPAADKKLWSDAAFGEDHDLNFIDRGDRLENTYKVIGGANPQSFKDREYLSDWVKSFGQKQKEVSSGSPFAAKTEVSSSPFVNPKTGKPEVTDEHAIMYIKSDDEGRVDQKYTWRLDNQLQDEIKSMRASGDPRTAWMKDKPDDEVMNELITNPKKNIINSQDFGIRKREMAKQDLRDAADIQTKVSVETKTDQKATGGLYKNDAIAYSPTYFNTATEYDAPADGEQAALTNATVRRKGSLAGPGGVLMISKGTTTGKAITFDAESRNAYLIRSGKKSQVVGKQPFNLTGYQLQVYKKDGTPYPIQAESTDELITKMRALPAHELNKLEPTPRLALSGYTLDKTRMLGDITNSSYNIAEEIGKASRQGNKEKLAQLNEQLNSITELKEKINNGDLSDEDILNAAASSGITGIRTDQLIRADQADLDKINNITNGLNLKDRNKWSDDMRRFDDAYQTVYREKTAAPQNTPTPTVPETKKKAKFPLPAGKPRTVSQNGYTYTWNDQTGSYE
jgi:hypothetical protein